MGCHIKSESDIITTLQTTQKPLSSLEIIADKGKQSIKKKDWLGRLPFMLFL